MSTLMNKWKAGRAALLSATLIAATTAGCQGSQGAAPCKTNTDCFAGSACGADGVCRPVGSDDGGGPAQAGDLANVQADDTASVVWIGGAGGSVDRGVEQLSYTLGGSALLGEFESAAGDSLALGLLCTAAN